MKKMYFFQSKITLSIAALSFILFLFSSCRKETNGDQCFDNRTNEPIDLYIDGFYEFTIDENDDACVFLGEGCYDWFVEGVDSGDFSEGVVCLQNGNFATTIVIDD